MEYITSGILLISERYLRKSDALVIQTSTLLGYYFYLLGLYNDNFRRMIITILAILYFSGYSYYLILEKFGGINSFSRALLIDILKYLKIIDEINGWRVIHTGEVFIEFEIDSSSDEEEEVERKKGPFSPEFGG